MELSAKVRDMLASVEDARLPVLAGQWAGIDEFSRRLPAVGAAREGKRPAALLLVLPVTCMLSSEQVPPFSPVSRWMVR